MEIAAALTADLTLLTQALDDQGADIETTLVRLLGTLTLAVPSCLGLTVTVSGLRRPYSFTTFERPVGPDDGVTSVRVTIPDQAAVGEPTVELTVYAGLSTAFVDLPAELAWLTGSSMPAQVRDAYPARGSENEPRSIVAFSIIDQAMGVLIGQGHTPEGAQRVLIGRTDHARFDLHTAALAVLATLVPIVAEGT